MNEVYQEALEDVLDDLDMVMADLEDILEDAQEDGNSPRDIQRMEEAMQALQRAAELLSDDE